MMVLTDVGALPLRFLGGWKNFNREIVYRQATSALEELHSQGIIHGNISKDTVWVNPDDSSAWIMCFGNAVVNGQGWTSFHSARWGRAQTSKIDFQGLAEAFSQ
jgi:serine/threonine protein kinase